jgi:hypothetical protein
MRLGDAAGEDGPFGFIAKPFAKQQLARELRLLLDAQAAPT